MKSPFKQVFPYHLSESARVFEAEFELPNDGTPETINRLVIQLQLDPPDTQHGQLAVISRTGYADRTKDYSLSCSSVNVKSVSSLLYGFARLITRQSIEVI